MEDSEVDPVASSGFAPPFFALRSGTADRLLACCRLEPMGAQTYPLVTLQSNMRGAVGVAKIETSYRCVAAAGTWTELPRCFWMGFNDADEDAEEANDQERIRASDFFHGRP